MQYREIVAVTGLSGLFQLLTTKSDGAIVRSVAEKTTKFISARQHNVTPLESIEVYTTGDNVRLQTVFQKMMEQETAFPPSDVKTNDNAAIKAYFKNIFPEFDEERVYVSDMKKMLKWFEILRANDLLQFEAEETEEAAPAEEAPAVEAAPVTEEAPAEKPAKKAAKKKKAEPAEDAAESTEEKPAKKTAKKKKTEE